MKTALLLSVLCAAMAVTASLTCGNATCGNDEACNSGATDCLCNNTYYTYSAANPSPNVTCDGGKFNILVPKCWLEKNRYDTTNIRLENTSCLALREVVNGIAQMGIHRALDTTDCGTTSESNATHVTYSNRLYIFAKMSPIITRKNVVMNISCTYPLNSNNVTFNISLNPVLGSTEITVPGSSASFTVNMVAYTDDTFTTALSSTTDLYVEQIIYISVIIPELDVGSFKLKVVRIYATGDGSNATQYNLLVDECPATGITADLLYVINNGNNNEARFRMKVFQIAGSSSVRLFADVVVCKASDTSCARNCTAQSKSAKSEESGATVSVILQPSERFADFSSASSFSMPWTLPALLFSWILVKLICLDDILTHPYQESILRQINESVARRSTTIERRVTDSPVIMRRRRTQWEESAVTSQPRRRAAATALRSGKAHFMYLSLLSVLLAGAASMRKTIVCANTNLSHCDGVFSL
ncbi:PREDICTED: uromodulin-like [Nanorana parkeri]|uniref:uromodulin-like n=1 Tax=Nanorana parkeri TaxID=125878 RepID=UPI0008543AB7|nr:PREDICTED: uromodulin-like [Nanorana parkeri]